VPDAIAFDDVIKKFHIRPGKEVKLKHFVLAPLVRHHQMEIVLPKNNTGFPCASQRNSPPDTLVRSK